jgi:hypothetical protein
VYQLALNLVEDTTMAIPYTTRNGLLHILPVLTPDLIYLGESLNNDGVALPHLQAWYRNDLIILVRKCGGGALSNKFEVEIRKGEWRARRAGAVGEEELPGDWSSRVLSQE